MSRIEVGNYLVIDPEICHGQMTFNGTRVPVDTVLALLTKASAVHQLRKSYPELTRDAIAETRVRHN